MDEAGRGCVLGPLVVGAFVVEAGDEPRLTKAGATDSKRLSAKRREAVLSALDGLGTADRVHVTAREIDAENINTLELRAFGTLIARLRPDHVLLDAPCHPAAIPAFLERLGRYVTGLGAAMPSIVAEPKADLNYPVVGAASIVAKVARDAEIAALGPVGSGYPSDPKTRAWLMDFLKRDAPLPDCVRTRWGTIENLRQQALFG